MPAASARRTGQAGVGAYAPGEALMGRCPGGLEELGWRWGLVVDVEEGEEEQGGGGGEDNGAAGHGHFWLGMSLSLADGRILIREANLQAMAVWPKISMARL